jgi:Tfp pilus assembly protein PilF
MSKHKLLIIAGITLATAFCCCGCNDHAKKKQAMIQQWDQNTATNNIKTVQALLENGNIDQAIKTLEECIAKAPALVHAHIMLGKAYFMQSEFDKAGKSFAEAVDLDS